MNSKKNSDGNLPSGISDDFLLRPDKRMQSILQRLNRQFCFKDKKDENVATKNRNNQTGQIRSRRQYMYPHHSKIGTNVNGGNQSKQQKKNQRQRPPDQAAADFGRELAKVFQLVDEIKYKEQILHALTANAIHVSVPYTFFRYLSTGLSNETVRSMNWDWLPNWILDCEKNVLLQQSQQQSILNNPTNTAYDTLSAAIHAYAIITYSTLSPEVSKQNVRTSSKTDDNHRSYRNSLQQDLTNVYRKLKASSSRMCLLREFSRASQDLEKLPILLSPLMAACVLSQSTPGIERTLFLQELWRQCWDSIYAAGDDLLNDFWNVLFWMTKALILFVRVLPVTDSLTTPANYNGKNNNGANQNRSAYNRTKCASQELAQCWVMELADMVAFAVNVDDVSFDTSKTVAAWLHMILKDTLPALAATVDFSYRLSLQPVYEQVFGLIEVEKKHLFQFDTLLAFRLSTMALSTPRHDEISSILYLCNTLMPTLSSHSISMLRALGAIYRYDETCRPEATNLLKRINQIQQQTNEIDGNGQNQGQQRTNNNAESTSRDSSSTGTNSSKETRSTANHYNALPQTSKRSLKNDEVSIPAASIRDDTGNITKSTNLTSIVQLLDSYQHDSSSKEILQLAAKNNAFHELELSIIQQSEALLFGIAMFENEDIELRTLAKTYLKDLVKEYQHLGVSLFPALIETVNELARLGNAVDALDKLEFLCEAVISDPSCGQIAWNLLGVQLMKTSTPMVLRLVIIRLFPRICATNKRMYRRVINTLGSHLHNNDTHVEIKLAVAVTIADLAKEDRIRDVSDVIGWVQGFLTADYSKNNCSETNSGQIHVLLVYYAIITLHHLVMNEELDFNLVIKVLNKRLCPISDFEKISQLPSIVLEALALLLGDGECTDTSSSDSDDDNIEHDQNENNKVTDEVNVSPQVTAAVQTLINLIQHVDKQFARSSNLSKLLQKNDHINEMTNRIRRNIYESLAKYSTKSLGLDPDGINATINWQQNKDKQISLPPVNGLRYLALRKIMIDGIQLPQKVLKQDNCEYHIMKLASKIIMYEEEILRVKLWRSRGSKHGVFANKVGVTAGGSTASIGGTSSNELHPRSLSDLAALPSPMKIKLYDQQKISPVSVIAKLLCFDGKPLNSLKEIARACDFDNHDPLITVFTIQGWLQASVRLLSGLHDGTKLQLVDETLFEIRGWKNGISNYDNVYLCLASLAIYIPHNLRRNHEMPPTNLHHYQQPMLKEERTKFIVNDIYEEIWDAFISHQFQKPDIANVCIGLVAVSALRHGSLEYSDKAIESLEYSIKGYDGQISFGACYALAIIAQALPQVIVTTPSDESRSEIVPRIRRITGFLLKELLACVAETNEVLNHLVDCIQSGLLTPGLVGSIADVGPNSLLICAPKKDIARYLFVCLALCLPGLTHVNGDLLLGVLFLLESFPWGSGKGIALPPLIHECRALGVLQEDEFDHVCFEYASTFEKGLDGEPVEGMDDIFYAVNGTAAKPVPHAIRRILVGNHDLFDDIGCAFSLMAAVVSLSSLPCLGFGATYFYLPAQLRTDISTEVIESVVELTSDSVNKFNDSSYSRIALIMLGYLASMRIPPIDFNRFNSSPSSTYSGMKSFGIGSTSGGFMLADNENDMFNNSEGSRSATTGGYHSSNIESCALNLDFALLPSPLPGTSVSEIIFMIRQFCRSGYTASANTRIICGVNSSNSGVENLVRLLKCLESLKLPGNFAPNFISPLLTNRSKEIKMACISLITSQIIKSRRNGNSNKDFIQVAINIASLPITKFRALFTDHNAYGAIQLFVTNLVHMFPRFPADSLEIIVDNIWQVCISLGEDEGTDPTRGPRSAVNDDNNSNEKEINQLRRKLIFLFIQSLRDILRLYFLEARTDTNKNSGSNDKDGNMQKEKEICFLQRFAVEKVFSDLRKLSWFDVNEKNNISTTNGHFSDEIEGILSGTEIQLNPENENGYDNLSSDESIIDVYVTYLMEIPLNVLDNLQFFNCANSDGFNGEILRTTCILELIMRGYTFEGKDNNGDERCFNEISKQITWFAKKLVNLGQHYIDTAIMIRSLRRIIPRIAYATDIESSTMKPSILFSVLDFLLLLRTAPTCIIGLELLSFMLSCWCSNMIVDAGELSLACLCLKGKEKLYLLSDDAINQIYLLLRQDLPVCLATFCNSDAVNTYPNRNKTSLQISNHVWRLCNAWSKVLAIGNNSYNEEENNRILSCLKKALLCCNSHYSSNATKVAEAGRNEEDFIELIGSMLYDHDYPKL